MKRAKSISKRPISIKKLEKKLQRILYPLIKKRDGNVCISCGKRNLVGRDWHAGHFIKAELCNIEYRYDPKNIHSQCSYCNHYLAGNFIEYEKAMIKKYGPRTVKKMKEDYKKSLPVNFDSRKYIEDSIDFYSKNPINIP